MGRSRGESGLRRDVPAHFGQALPRLERAGPERDRSGDDSAHPRRDCAPGRGASLRVPGQLGAPALVGAREIDVAVTAGVLRQIFLVVLLGGPELLRRLDCGRDRLAVPVRASQLGLRVLGRLALLVGVREDRRAVRAAAVVSLTIDLSRVVDLPEVVEQPLVGDDLWVVLDLHRFGVPGAACADLLVARVLSRAPAIAGGCSDDALHAPEIGLDTPEAARREGCPLGITFHLQPSTSKNYWSPIT